MVYVLWYTSVMKNGLVLGGGGAKGCYEVGSLQAFEECNIKFDCVAGTSIGAIIGAIYTQQTIDEVVDFVYAISPGQIVKDFFEFPDNFNDVLENKEQIKTFLEHFIKEKSMIFHHWSILLKRCLIMTDLSIPISNMRV